MKLAYILYEGITLLDFIGVYDPLSRIKSGGYLREFGWDTCAAEETVKDSFGLEVKVGKTKPDLSGYDMIVIPGGFGTRRLLTDEAFMDWLKSAEKVPSKVSICTGSLLLGAAGFLKNCSATTHYSEYDNLAKYCRKVVNARIVDDGGVITAGAVSSSLDLGLYLCEKLLGKTIRMAIQKSMDFLPGNFEIHKITPTA